MRTTALFLVIYLLFPSTAVPANEEVCIEIKGVTVCDNYPQERVWVEPPYTWKLEGIWGDLAAEYSLDLEQLSPVPNSDTKREGEQGVWEPVPGASKPADTKQTDAGAAIESSREQILATRTFVGPHDVPPTATAAYGIIAFPNLAMPTTRARYLAVCHAYWAAMQESSRATAPVQEQMVTVWPVQSEAIAGEIIADNNMIEGCESAVDRYDLGTGQLAIRHANIGREPRLRGIGPYLLAWSPSSAKGNAGVPVLLLDLSGATNERQFQNYFTTWKEEIQLRPELWDENDGWWLEEVRRRFSEFSDETGGAIMTFLMGGSQ